MTEVRTFKAASMQEALELVRRELGTDAVILHTRQTSQRRILPWVQPRKEVEITAGLGVNILPPGGRSTRVERQTVAAQSATQGNGFSQGIAGGGPKPARPTQPSVSHSLPESSDADSGVELQIESLSRKAATIPRMPAVQLEEPVDSDPQTQIAARFAVPAARPVETPTEPPVPPGNQRPAESTAELSSKLDSIQKMVECLGRSRSGGGAPEIPNELFHLYTELIDADVEDELARDLIFRLKHNCTPAQLGDSTVAKAMLSAMVESEIRCSAPITATRGRRKVVALVGPTGVGKTTTIAKLAANFRLRDGIRMGLVTVDTYRIAAVEQLRTYAEIIDLPMKVVTSPMEMRRALDELSGMDLVLIDTAGRSPRDELKIQELKSLLAEADVDEVHLVLSLTASLRSITATAEKFAAANTTSLILTKLDEAAAMGSLVSVARNVALPMSYLTTGQDVPDDIEPGNASRIARLVLGQDRLFI